jgi:hypothetical protein
MACATMDRTRPLFVNEWLEFLRDDVQLPMIAQQEIKKLATKLADRSKSINDFIQLSEKQLVNLSLFFLLAEQIIFLINR